MGSAAQMVAASVAAVPYLPLRWSCWHPHRRKEHTQTYTHMEALLNWTSAQCLFMTTSPPPLHLYTDNRMPRSELHVCSSRPVGQVTSPHTAKLIFLSLPRVLSFDPKLPLGVVFLVKRFKTQKAESGFEHTNMSFKLHYPTIMQLPKHDLKKRTH